MSVTRNTPPLCPVPCVVNSWHDEKSTHKSVPCLLAVCDDQVVNITEWHLWIRFLYNGFDENNFAIYSLPKYMCSEAVAVWFFCSHSLFSSLFLFRPFSLLRCSDVFVVLLSIICRPQIWIRLALSLKVKLKMETPTAFCYVCSYVLPVDVWRWRVNLRFHTTFGRMIVFTVVYPVCHRIAN